MTLSLSHSLSLCLSLSHSLHLSLSLTLALTHSHSFFSAPFPVSYYVSQNYNLHQSKSAYNLLAISVKISAGAVYKIVHLIYMYVKFQEQKTENPRTFNLDIRCKNLG